MSDTDLLFGQVVELYLAESKRIWNDPAIWIEERDRKDHPAPVIWPMLTDEGSAYDREVAAWFNAEVEVVVVALSMARHPALPVLPPAVEDPRFQLVLRVVARAWEAGRQAVEREFAGERITGWGAYQSEWRAEVVDWMVRKHRPRDEARKAFGISKAAMQRILKKSRSVRDYKRGDS